MSCGTSRAPSDMVEWAWQSTGFHTIRLRDLERIRRRIPLTGRGWLGRVRHPRPRGGIERLAHVERRVRGALLDGLSPGNEVLGHDHVDRTVRIGQLAGRAVDLARRDALRPWPVRRRWPASVDLGHERRVHRSRELAALRVRLDLLRTIEAHPHAGDEVG